MKTPVFLLLVIGMWSSSGFGQEAAAPAPPPAAASDSAAEQKARRAEFDRAKEARIHSQWNICVDVQMVALDEGKALEMIPQWQSDDQQTVDAAWAKLQEMIKAKEATLLGWPMVRVANEDRASTESILEKRYPTEFEPPQQPTNAPPAPVLPPRPADKPMVENAIPTAFETRNIGVTLEVEAVVLDEGKRVHVGIVPQRVELLDMEKNESALPKEGRIVQVPQPLFGDSKSTQAFTLWSGRRQLIAVHKLSRPANQIELHFVRAVVTKTE